jgi:hypothetical protein
VKWLAPLTLVALLVALAGCGSSSSSSSTPATDAAASGEATLTKAEFIAKADALCEATKAKGEPLRKKLEELARKVRAEEQSRGGISDSGRRELAQALERIGAIAEAGLRELRALGAPRADATRLEAIFQKSESAFAASNAYAAALENHEDAKAQAVAEKGDAETRETASLAKQYGFKACGSRP